MKIKSESFTGIFQTITNDVTFTSQKITLHKTMLYTCKDAVKMSWKMLY